MLTSEQLAEIRERPTPSGLGDLYGGSVYQDDHDALLASHEEAVALGRELARELDYTLRHEASCLEAISLHGKRCTCGYRHEDKRAALAKARAAGLLA